MSIKKNFSYNLLLTLSNILFPVITFPIISHTIGPIGVGKIQFINTYVQYFILISALGIPMYGIREVAKARINLIILKTTITELFILNALTSIILTCTYFVTIFTISPLKMDYNYYLIASLMLITSFGNIEWLFSGLEQFKFIAIRSLIVKVLSFILIILLLKSEKDILSYLWIIVITNVVNNFWNLFKARNYLVLYSLKNLNIRKHLKPIIYIFSTIAAISIYAILDTLFLGFIKGYEAVGYYTAATRLSKPIIPVLTALGTVLIPRISSSFEKNDFIAIKKYAMQSMNYVIFIGVPITFLIAILSKELIIILCGRSFLEASFCLKLFAFISLIIGLSNVWAIQILTPAKKDKFVMYSVIGGLIVSIVLNLILIPRFSYNGAAVSNLFTELLVMGAFAFFSNRFFKISLEINVIFKALCSTILFYPIYLLNVHFLSNNLYYVCAFTILISVATYLIIQLFIFKNDILITHFFQNSHSKIIV